MVVAEAARKLRDRGLDVVDFGPGEPDFATPDNVKRAGIRAIEDDFCKYTAVSGIDELKRAIVDRHTRDLGSDYGIDNVVVNVGGKHSVFSIFAALIEDGDEVIIPTPYWVSFRDITSYAGATPVFVNTQEADGFRLTSKMVEDAITPRTRLLIVNSPNNPSGAVLDDDEFIRIAKVCQDRGVIVMSDECYAYFLYDGRPPFSIASVPEVRDSIVVAGSLSKTYAMTGWRIGYVLGDESLIRGIGKLQSHSTSNPTSISQKAAVEALTGPQDSVRAMLDEYAARRRYVVDRLRSIPGIQCPEPGGAFYAYPNVSSAFDSGVQDVVDFAVQLLEKHQVAVVPGVAFGTTDHIRLSYAASLEDLKKGLDRIEEFMGNLSR
jgi:aspartate aminotransferase